MVAVPVCLGVGATGLGSLAGSLPVCDSFQVPAMQLPSW